MLGVVCHTCRCVHSCPKEYQREGTFSRNLHQSEARGRRFTQVFPCISSPCFLSLWVVPPSPHLLGQLPPSRTVSPCFFLSQGHLWGCPLGSCLPSLQVCNLARGTLASMETRQLWIIVLYYKYTQNSNQPLEGGTVHPSSATCQITCERQAGQHTMTGLP